MKATQGTISTLGVVGGGQLGRMFVHAAQRLGFQTVVLDPEPEGPAGQVAHRQICAAYDDAQGLVVFQAAVDAVTTEFENVPAATLAALAQHRPVAPGAPAVAVCQDRVLEKRHFTEAGVPCAPYAVIESLQSCDVVDTALLPGILKTARLGYDGKGQVRIRTREELLVAWKALGEVPCVLEALLPLAAEVSVLLARGDDGQAVAFPVQENIHESGILALTQVPAPSVPPALQQEAVESALRIADSLHYRGVLCVEFFVLRDGSLVANEMAPRPHNSGHYSLDACDVSQFDLQVRATAGLPLVTPRLHSPACMLNLLGDAWWDAEGRCREPDWAGVLGWPGVHLHLYGKAEARKGRKMGHITVTAPSLEAARATSLRVARHLGLSTVGLDG